MQALSLKPAVLGLENRGAAGQACTRTEICAIKKNDFQKISGISVKNARNQIYLIVEKMFECISTKNFLGVCSWASRRRKRGGGWMERWMERWMENLIFLKKREKKYLFRISEVWFVCFRMKNLMSWRTGRDKKTTQNHHSTFR